MTTSLINSKAIKADFPILSRQVNGKDLVYLDNSATSQKPQVVIDAIVHYYQNHNANVHRGVHTLSDESTREFENSRANIAKFFGAKSSELIFVQNTTQASNAVAYGYGEYNVTAGDVILVTTLDHHSNIVVWQELCKRKNANLIFVKITPDGQVDLEDLENKVKKFADVLKIVALPHVSNALGSVLDLKKAAEIVRNAHSSRNSQSINNIAIFVDGAQSAPHMKINFDSLDIDFFAFSGHKMLAPMGIGGLLVKENLLKSEKMQPWLFGGGMIAEVHEDKTLFHPDISERFVAGTPDVASVVGLSVACDYINSLGGMKALEQHDKELVAYAYEKLSKIPEVTVIGPEPANRMGSVSFLYQGVHAHDVAQVLDSQGLAVRSGHHCTMPLHTAQNWIATTRASFQVYNTKEDIDKLCDALEMVKKILL